MAINAFTVSGSFTRPADTTAYASGDAVANSTTAGSVVPVSLSADQLTKGSGRIRRVRISKTGTSVTTCTLRAHFFTASPTSAAGDNAAWSTNKAANWLGACDVIVDKAFTDGAAGAGAPLIGTEISFVLTPSAAFAQTLYVLLEARSAYTPASAEVFTVSAEVEQA